MKTLVERLRWRIATLLDKLPGQCWANLADWPLGTRRFPWAPIDDVCRKDMERLGGCYCGKLRKPETILPVNTSDEQCPKCWVLPGVTHELSCDEVTPQQFRDFLAAQGRAR